MKKLKTVALGLAMLGILVTSSTAFASSSIAASGVIGGWDEEKGSFSINNGEIGILSGPSSHQGWKEERNGDWRAVAVTHWDSEHYSRAQLYQRRLIGSDVVKADSGRIWCGGSGSSEARTPWVDREYSARTFYGN
ncbi:hypothetical protein PRVXT_000993 [Proteinivorax tanatarense]|uniref:Bacteriocin n=1 Tax=Proteinivorax tanatarense TaxID=1260629 RepID=A0AAU7VP57_9FIRM